jgi:hypothetical protein
MVRRIGGFALITVFLFLHETSWNRQPGAENATPPASFIANRIATFLPGNKVTTESSFAYTVSSFKSYRFTVQSVLIMIQMKITRAPFLISLSPVTLILSVFTLIHFGFYVAMNSLSPVFLQKPVKAGGYSFTVKQNAECKFQLHPLSSCPADLVFSN